MKRSMRRTMRNAGTYPAIAQDAEYLPKHAKIADIFAEVTDIFAEVCEALNITADYVKEVAVKNIEKVRKIAEKIRIRPIKLECVVIRETSILARPMNIDWKGVISCQ